ncbi:phytanoyl-CoA dioxygenase family protein [Alphaproteobacteria bacterium]|nr:phytanoyl-CoA dioxygenase family protein [Alphaproteobacteria bacterium]
MNFHDKRQHFDEDGFVISRKLFEVEELLSLRGLVSDFFVSRMEGSVSDELKNCADLSLDRIMISLRQSDKMKFGNLYDTIQTIPAFVSLATSETIIREVSGLLGTSPSALSWSGLLFRADVPEDNRNTISWHQDHSYLPFNVKGRKGVVITIPLQDTTESMGAVRLKSRSHGLGVIKPELDSIQSSGSSEQRLVPNSMLGGFDEVAPELKLGDALCMHMSTVHASGYNTSNFVRMSLLIRYHCNNAPDFIPYKMSFKAVR